MRVSLRRPSGEPALVESTAGDDDIAPPVLGVPPSSGDEEELLADRAGAPLLGVDLVDGEAQTEHISPIIAFDAHDVAVQTANEVMFSSFVGDTSQEALATAIRALSWDDRDRLVGVLRLAEEQPLVDVAPVGGAGDPSSSSGPPLGLLDLTPGLPPAPTGVVDPGPSPATARTFWEEQDATSVAEMAAAKPVPDDDIDAGPPTSLELFLAEQEVAATGPPASGASSSSTPGPGPKKPFKKAPPPALVIDEPKASPSTKAPPMLYPDKPIRFWTTRRPSPSPRLEAAIASGPSTPPQSVSAGVILRSLPSDVRGGRLPRERPADFTQWIGWCFVKCPGSHRRGQPCPDRARCLRPVNYPPPMLGRPHEHHECQRCAPPTPGQRFD